MIGECAWCGGALSSETAVTVFGAWKQTHGRYTAIERAGVSGADQLPVWCSVACREASGSPALGSVVYPNEEIA